MVDWATLAHLRSAQRLIKIRTDELKFIKQRICSSHLVHFLNCHFCSWKLCSSYKPRCRPSSFPQQLSCLLQTCTAGITVQASCIRFVTKWEYLVSRRESRCLINVHPEICTGFSRKCCCVCYSYNIFSAGRFCFPGTPVFLTRVNVVYV